MPFSGETILEVDTMNELIKIKDVSARYAITARTLRYYEDIGLLTSTRTEDYAHRVYDEAAITRLQQIIILRKLNIRIKDIKRVFDAPDSEVVLDVLGKKADDIDDEVALLHELKGTVLDFIKQIKQSDFHNDAEVKLLYDKAKEIENHLSVVDYNGNSGRMGEQFAQQTTSPGRIIEQAINEEPPVSNAKNNQNFTEDIRYQGGKRNPPKYLGNGSFVAA